MLKALKKYIPAGGFESSSGLTREFSDFYREFAREIKKELKKAKATEITVKRGHFDAGGFYKVGDQWYYFSLPDVRCIAFGDDDPSLLYRTVEGPRDYTGGRNNYIKMTEDMFLRIHGGN